MPEQQESFQIKEADLDELEHIQTLLIRAFELKKVDSLYALFQRMKFITMRIRGVEE